MKFNIRRWLIVFTLAAATLVGLWQWRDGVGARARQRLAQEYQQRLAELPERQAASLVHELASDQPPWLGVLVEAAIDQRVAVATAAETELRLLVDKWSESPGGDSASQATELAALLAKHAASWSADGKRLANVLARSLLVLPINSRQLDVAKYIADCEAVLRLEPTPPEEIRVASANVEPAIQPAGAEVQPVEPGRFQGSATGRISER